MESETLLSDSGPVQGHPKELSLGLDRARENIVDQLVRQIQSDGFRLKIMVVGESGLGKVSARDPSYRVTDKSCDSSYRVTDKSLALGGPAFPDDHVGHTVPR